MTDTHIHTSNASCEEVLDFLCAQFGDEDDSERCQQVKRHLDKCPDCGKYCNSLEQLIGLYRAASPEFPPEARQYLLDTLGIKD